MRKIFKIILSFSIIIFNFNIVNFAESNKISKITITVNVNKDGTADVIEIWDANIYSGTELYHSFEKLEENMISNFNVYEDSQKYDQIQNWDITRKSRK